jgi:hypothetical protein
MSNLFFKSAVAVISLMIVTPAAFADERYPFTETEWQPAASVNYEAPSRVIRPVSRYIATRSPYICTPSGFGHRATCVSRIAAR